MTATEPGEGTRLARWTLEAMGVERSDDDRAAPAPDDGRARRRVVHAVERLRAASVEARPTGSSR